MNSLLQDIRYGARMLRKSAGFTAIALVTLGVGIGATAAMFAVVDAVLIRPLPYPHADRVVYVTESLDRRPGMSIAFANFEDWQARNQVFSSMALVRGHRAALTGVGVALPVTGHEVTSHFFETLGVAPIQGRDFTEADDKPGAAPVVVISYGFWQRQFAGRNVVGSSLLLDKEPYTIIGVLPRSFSYGDEQRDVFVSMGRISEPEFRTNRFAHAGSKGIARLKPGVTLEQARANMDAVARQLQQQYPTTNGRNWVSLRPLRDWIVGDTRTPLLILLGAVGLLLLIACANIANLLLARGSGRSRELGIRAAIGATPSRLLRQLLTESVLLSLMGGVLGVLLATLATHALVTAAPRALPRVGEIHLNATVLAFTLALSVITGILFGVAPALQAPDKDVSALQDGTRTVGANRKQKRMSGALVVGEVALALALLCGAGLLVRSFQRVMQVDAGFEAKGLLTARIAVPQGRYQNEEQMEAFFRAVLGNVRAIPGVTAASQVEPLPMSGSEWDSDFALEGRRIENGQYSNSEVGYLGPDYGDAMKLPVVAGRLFTEADNASSLPVAVVNQEFVRKFFAGQNAIGKRIRMGDPDELRGPESKRSPWLTIVGVVGNVKQYGLDERTVATMYAPVAQQVDGRLTERYLVVRTTLADPLTLTEPLRNATAQANPDQAIGDVDTMEHEVHGRLATRQLSMALLGTFAALAMVLGGIGIYGVVAYSVAQRTREIGIRMALGARSGQVMALIMKQALKLLGAGLVLGLAASLGLGRYLQSMLFGVGATNVAVFGLVTLLLGGVVMLASYIPARRAMQVDPVVALRQA